MADPSKLFVTGVPELDLALRKVELRVAKKAVNKALRTTSNTILADAKSRMPIDTGTLHDSLVVRAPRARGATRSRQSRLGPALQVQVDTNLLYRNYVASHGGDPPVGEDGRAFFYPAAIELGSGTKGGLRPMSKALYGNSGFMLSVFTKTLKAALAGEKIARVPRVASALERIQ